MSMKAAELPEFLTVDELSALIHRPQGTLRNWRYKGIGPKFVRLGGSKYGGGRVLYPVIGVKDWLDTQVSS